jgi:hypothetical protein
VARGLHVGTGRHGTAGQSRHLLEGDQFAVSGLTVVETDFTVKYIY